jgi:hypothetical protein
VEGSPGADLPLKRRDLVQLVQLVQVTREWLWEGRDRTLANQKLVFGPRGGREDVFGHDPYGANCRAIVCPLGERWWGWENTEKKLSAIVHGLCSAT